MSHLELLLLRREFAGAYKKACQAAEKRQGVEYCLDNEDILVIGSVYAVKRAYDEHLREVLMLHLEADTFLGKVHIWAVWVKKEELKDYRKAV